MKIISTFLVLTLGLGVLCSAQTPDNTDNIVRKDPIFFLDEVRISNEEIQKINPKDVAAIEVLKDSTATSRFGEEGKNGVIYVTTISYARKKYIEFFQSKSDEYAHIIQSTDDENNVVYILNNKILGKENTGELYFIDDNKYIELKIINKAQLKKKYHIKDKKSGIIITTKLENKE